MVTGVNSLEGGLKRLLGLCPELTLDTRQIQLIVDGNKNQVISEYKGTWKEPEVVPTPEVKVEDKTEEEEAVTTTIKEEAESDSDFNEYFTDK